MIVAAAWRETSFTCCHLSAPSRELGWERTLQPTRAHPCLLQGLSRASVRISVIFITILSFQF